MVTTDCDIFVIDKEKIASKVYFLYDCSTQRLFPPFLQENFKVRINDQVSIDKRLTLPNEGRLLFSEEGRKETCEETLFVQTNVSTTA